MIKRVRNRSGAEQRLGAAPELFRGSVLSVQSIDPFDQLPPPAHSGRTRNDRTSRGPALTPRRDGFAAAVFQRWHPILPASIHPVSPGGCPLTLPEVFDSAAIPCRADHPPGSPAPAPPGGGDRHVAVDRPEPGRAPVVGPQSSTMMAERSRRASALVGTDDLPASFGTSAKSVVSKAGAVHSPDAAGIESLGALIRPSVLFARIVRWFPRRHCSHAIVALVSRCLG